MSYTAEELLYQRNYISDVCYSVTDSNIQAVRCYVYNVQSVQCCFILNYQQMFKCGGLDIFFTFKFYY
jgi:hypothetical protein